MDVETIVKHKFLEGSNMTFQEVFDFAFKSLIPVLQGLANHCVTTLQPSLPWRENRVTSANTS